MGVEDLVVLLFSVDSEDIIWDVLIELILEEGDEIVKFILEELFDLFDIVEFCFSDLVVNWWLFMV